SQSYQAFAADKAGHRLGEVTDRTAFSISPSGDCAKASCTPTQVGAHTVTGRLTLGQRTVQGSATLTVRLPVDHLELEPATASIGLGDSQSYQAFAADKARHRPGGATVRAGFSR